MPAYQLVDGPAPWHWQLLLGYKPIDLSGGRPLTCSALNVNIQCQVNVRALIFCHIRSEPISVFAHQQQPECELPSACAPGMSWGSWKDINGLERIWRPASATAGEVGMAEAMAETWHFQGGAGTDFEEPRMKDSDGVAEVITMVMSLIRTYNP